MTFALDHAAALEELIEFGSPVTFRTTATTRDPLTGESSTASTTVAGHAMQVRGTPEVYERLTLIESAAPTLLFAAATYGGRPELGATVTWAGKERTVKDVTPVAPDGTTILARVVVA